MEVAEIEKLSPWIIENHEVIKKELYELLQENEVDSEKILNYIRKNIHDLQIKPAFWRNLILLENRKKHSLYNVGEVFPFPENKIKIKQELESD